MKHAKLILSGIAILAVVSGILAFKARGINTFFTSDPADGICSIKIKTTWTTTSPNFPGALTANYSTTLTTTTCLTWVTTTF